MQKPTYPFYHFELFAIKAAENGENNKQIMW